MLMLLHPNSFAHNPSNCCIWTSSHQMIRPYTLNSFRFSQIFSNNSVISFGISAGNRIGCSSRIPAIMASSVSTAGTAQQHPISTQDESSQNSVTRPLQVSPVFTCFGIELGLSSFAVFWLKIEFLCWLGICLVFPNCWNGWLELDLEIRAMKIWGNMIIYVTLWISWF